LFVAPALRLQPFTAAGKQRDRLMLPLQPSILVEARPA
jgi:hypothetical protein